MKLLSFKQCTSQNALKDGAIAGLNIYVGSPLRNRTCKIESQQARAARS